MHLYSHAKSRNSLEILAVSVGQEPRSIGLIAYPYLDHPLLVPFSEKHDKQDHHYRACAHANC